MPRVPAISLFSGAGGFDLGARLAGCESLVCVDNDSAAVQTLRMNRAFQKAEKLCSDVRDLDGRFLLRLAGVRKGTLALVIGGPPCQSFSKAAYWTSTGEEARRRRASSGLEPSKRATHRRPRQPEQDERSHLVNEYLRLVQELAPKAFVFENVASLLHPTNRKVFSDFVRRSERVGYAVSCFSLNAAEFGVAQQRHRVFVIGIRDHDPIAQPTASHSLKGENNWLLKPAIGVAEIIEPFRSIKFAEDGEAISGKWSDALRQIPPGSNYKALTAWAGHPKPLFEAETRFWNFLLKLHPKRPSWTITANPGPWVGPFHWSNRRLRTTELAAIQGFPPAHKFSGERRSRIRQIGNAVPPPLAASVMRAVLEAIE